MLRILLMKNYILIYIIITLLSESLAVSPLSALSRPLRLFATPQSSRVNIGYNDNEKVLLDVNGYVDNLERMKNTRVGVLLLNLGGPDGQEDVEGFLYNLFADPDIIQLPALPCPLALMQKPLAYFISKTRSKKSAAAYQSIGGGSPIKKYTTDQADLLRQSLQKRGYSKVKTYFAMRYSAPFTEEVLAQIKRDFIQELVIIPLYPHYSISTTASSLKAIKKIFDREPKSWFKGKGSGLLERVTVIPYWYNRPEYVDIVSKLIVEKYEEFDDEQRRKGVHVLFSAHGVPQSYIAAGDPYQKQMEDCVALITSRIGELVDDSDDIMSRCHLSYQSRVGPVEWLRPYTDDKIKLLGKAGVKNLIVVPIAFVSEHIETLEEIDIEYRALAEESGITNWKRVPALNTDERFIEEMAAMTSQALMGEDLSISKTLSSQLTPLRTAQKSNRLLYTLLGAAATTMFMKYVSPFVQEQVSMIINKS